MDREGVTMEVIGGKKTPMDSTFYGVSRSGFEWIAQLDFNDQCYKIGRYDNKLAAAAAYDMEALRAYGKDFPELNFKYEVLESLENGMKLRDSTGCDFFVDRVSEAGEYIPISVPAAPIYNPVGGTYGNYVNAPVSEGAPPVCFAGSRTWYKRIVSAHTPSTSFCYEITFPHTNSLGLNLRPRCITYSSGGGQKYMGALVVVEITSLLSSIVYPGDILLCINGRSLVDFGDSYEFDKCTSAITSSPAPRIVRFLRPVGPTQPLSGAELSLFVTLPLSGLLRMDMTAQTTDTTRTKDGQEGGAADASECPHVSAKFNVVVTASSQTLQLVHLSAHVCDLSV